MTTEMESNTMSSTKADPAEPGDQDASMESDSNTDTRRGTSNAQPRVLTSGHVVQSTVKVEGRKENLVDRYKVLLTLLPSY